MSSFRSIWPAFLLLCLAGCAGDFVPTPYCAEVLGLNDRGPSITLYKTELGIFAGPCGLSPSRALWSIKLIFTKEETGVYDVRKAVEVKLSDVEQRWTHGTITLEPGGKSVDVRLYRTEGGAEVPWEHNAVYPIDR